MGGGSGKTQTVNQVQDTSPWGPQQGYLLDAFSEAQKTYNNVKSQGAYQGDFVAGANPNYVQGANSALDWNNTVGQSGLNTQMGLGADAAMGGQAGVMGALSGLFGNANADYTAGNLATANAYANNPYAGQMVDAAMTDARRQFGEVTMPGLSRMAGGTGNTNSTKTGIAEGIAQRGLMDKAADLSSTLRGNLWNSGLAQAGQENALRQNAMTAAGGLAGNLMSSGMNGMNSAYANAGTNAQTSALNGAALTAANQSVLDNQIARTQYAESQPWTQLTNYYNIIGNKSWGGTTTTQGTTKTTENPSLLSSIGSGVSILGSLFRCDARVKTNIVPTGDSILGFPLYEFEYIDKPGRVVGPMAHDVEQTHPDAIEEIDGVKHINFLTLSRLVGV